MGDEPYQSLYRRFRPQRFEEVRGQDHVVRALRNAVRESKVSHAYLFSGPRGTGKTSTARILAKALNCTALEDGEPCGACASCLAVRNGSSLDVHELDAASHNGVDAMRELVNRAALGTPGRWKVYIVDEVHMLSNSASNTLLKTLEEPPAHVVFVLATTDPQKVLPTIRSRAQHYEFRLLGGEVLSTLLADVNRAAGLGVPTDAIDFVVRKGKGSARDALSVLDQVAAAGGVEDETSFTDEVVEALCEKDAGRALIAVAEGCAAGREPRRLASDLLEHLRQGFLALMAPALVELADTPRLRVEEQARRLGPAALVRAMEQFGAAQAEMRDSLDPRISLEAALVRLARPEADTSAAALLERIEQLERKVGAAGAGPALQNRAVAPPTPLPKPPPMPSPSRQPPPQPTPQPTPQAPPQPPSVPQPQLQQRHPASPQPAAAMPSRDQLTKAWGDSVYRSLPGKAKARFSGGRFSEVSGGTAVFVVPNEVHASRCREVKDEVEAALALHFGTPVPLSVAVEQARHAPAATDSSGPDDHAGDPRPGDHAPAPVASAADRLKQAFPGAEEVPQ